MSYVFNIHAMEVEQKVAINEVIQDDEIVLWARKDAGNSGK